MNNKENACFSDNLSEYKLFTAKIVDCIDLSERHSLPKFMFFLDERQCALAEDVLRGLKFSNYLFYGGYSSAKRRILGIFPEFSEPDANVFPIVPILFSYRKQDSLKHKDFLGALMALMIKRESLGDILVGEGSTIVYSYNTVSDMILSSVDKIGSVGVKLSVYDGDEPECSDNYIDIDATVSSLRADCIVCALTNLSREKSADFIKSNGIDVNYRKIYSASQTLAEKDIISIRGYGKYIFDSINGRTKKDKLHISIKKYN